MKKIILLTTLFGTFLLANGETQDNMSNDSQKANNYYWEKGSDELTAEAGRRRGKGPRGRRRGGSGLR